jgi:hypothetical protein
MLAKAVEAAGGDLLAVEALMVAVRKAMREALARPGPWRDADERMIGRTHVKHAVLCGWLDLACALGWSVGELFSDSSLERLGEGEIVVVTGWSVVMVSQRTGRLVRLARRRP